MDLDFNRKLVILNGLIPALLLGWDAWRGQLGANAVNNGLHITGILSLIFLFLSLLITPLREVTGWNSLIAYRRALGLYGFFYASIHFVIYVALDRMGSLSGTFDEIVSRRFLAIGFVALLLMVPLGVTSTNVMIRKLGPARWKLLHRLAYVAVVLGVIHYYMLVKSDVRQPIAFALVLTPILGFRAVRHYIELRKSAANNGRRLLRSKITQSNRQDWWKGSLLVANVHSESHDVKTFRLVSENGGELPFEHAPGQYLNLTMSIQGASVRRAYTIASSPTQRAYVEITVKRHPSGIASQHLHDTVQKGDRLEIAAPSGKFSFNGRTTDRVLLIAGGVGVTPVMSMLRYLTDHGWKGRIEFIYVVKTRHDLVFKAELDGIVRRFSNVFLHVFLTREDSIDTDLALRCESHALGYPTESFLRDQASNPNTTPAYMCGPDSMMEAMTLILQKAGYPKDKIFTEVFSSPKSSDVSDAAPSQNDQANGDSASTVAATIVIHPSGTEVEAEQDQSILEAAEYAGILLPFECRSGICGQCKIQCREGRVHMEVTDALSSKERSDGYILACQAKALDPRIVIEI
jgi:ferredoxin-NADP reductase/DMSO/TMAO reductase YedYZ heme-binding membrane subunit